HPDFLLNLTNDSWYGDTAEPYQHLFLAKWRAIEFGIPMVRSTNTGITSVVYPDGSESERTGIYEETSLEISLPHSKSAPTPYQRFGILIMWVIWLSMTGIALGFSHLSRKTFANQIVQRDHSEEDA